MRAQLVSTPGNTANDAVHVLYADHHQWLVGWLRRRLGCTHGAADLAQDTFVRILGRMPEARSLREPRAYLSTIAQGLLVDMVRRQRLEAAYVEALAQQPEAVTPSPEMRLMLLETLAQIDRLLDGLADRARTAFLMSRLDGLDYRDIASQLGVSVSAVEKYMATAIRHCYLASHAA
ncbi:sigma-70 family RNA polymerase sigma factor [Pigmentiphaga aceris]|uniref:Sigma-70 family RNA polymerase sigma factor n=1 Tax=Pigmentiphaga aceris TaxID=1940612 RepID=A0A5C0AY85_9BURK|nr:sigma-70 family RNA polymerase sigma factor [Pigmentiphaga aceris]QEI07125.1 sigma-70 family RNA polymerase sigma factor [Pigmentiphaga aceris]